MSENKNGVRCKRYHPPRMMPLATDSVFTCKVKILKRLQPGSMQYRCPLAQRNKTSLSFAQLTPAKLRIPLFLHFSFHGSSLIHTHTDSASAFRRLNNHRNRTIPMPLKLIRLTGSLTDKCLPGNIGCYLRIAVAISNPAYDGIRVNRKCIL